MIATINGTTLRKRLTQERLGLRVLLAEEQHRGQPQSGGGCERIARLWYAAINVDRFAEERIAVLEVAAIMKRDGERIERRCSLRTLGAVSAPSDGEHFTIERFGRCMLALLAEHIRESAQACR